MKTTEQISEKAAYHGSLRFYTKEEREQKWFSEQEIRDAIEKTMKPYKSKAGFIAFTSELEKRLKLG